MNLSRVLLALALAAVFGAVWALLRGRGRVAAARRDRSARARTERDSAVVAVLRATSGFLAVLFLLKIVPALQTPQGLLRDDFLFPLWALRRPATAWWWFAPALVLAWAAAALWWRGIAVRARDGLFLAGGVLLACGLWTCLALTNDGYPDGLVAPFLRSADYQADVGRFGSFGAIWNGYTGAQPSLSVHGRTHPPGSVALLWLLGRSCGGNLTVVCFLVVLIGALAMIPLYGWARRLLTREEARAVCLLWIFTPAVTLYGATCMDMVFGLVLMMPLATFTAIATTDDPQRARAVWRAPALGACLGAELAVGFLFTFSTAVLAAALALVGASLLVRRARESTAVVISLATAAGVSLGLLLALRPAVGFDWLACLRTAVRLDGAEASPFLSLGYYLTTRLMDVLDFLVLAGVAASPIALGALRRGFPPRPAGAPDTRPRDTRLLSLSRAAGVAMGTFFLLGAYKIGETGRVFLFFMPLVAACVVRRLDAGEGRNGPIGLSGAGSSALGAVLGVQVAQTLLMQAFLDTRW